MTTDIESKLAPVVQHFKKLFEQINKDCEGTDEVVVPLTDSAFYAEQIAIHLEDSLPGEARDPFGRLIAELIAAEVARESKPTISRPINAAQFTAVDFPKLIERANGLLERNPHVIQEGWASEMNRHMSHGDLHNMLIALMCQIQVQEAMLIIEDPEACSGNRVVNGNL